MQISLSKNINYRIYPLVKDLESTKTVFYKQESTIKLLHLLKQEDKVI